MGDLTLADCKVGDVVILKEISEESNNIQLLSMGCPIGGLIKIERIAPFGDPLVISVENSFISLRKSVARKMRVDKREMHD